MVAAAPRATSALAGIRVLELGNYVAAPTAARLLADSGAEVIEVEQPGIGDQVAATGVGCSGANVDDVALHVGPQQEVDHHRHPDARGVRSWCGNSHLCVDVVLENYRPGKLEEWGFSPRDLAQHQDLIVVRISGYGQTGPYRDKPGFGGVAEAIGGLRYLTGHPHRPPTRVGVSIGDTLAGLYAVIGTLMGLLARERGGIAQGETVDVALTEAVLSVMESTVPEFSAYGVIRSRSGSAIEGVAPSNTYPCTDDEWVVIGGNTDAIFHRLMIAIDRPDLASDTRFTDNIGRAANSGYLDKVIGEWTLQRSVTEALRVLEAASVPSGPIYSAADIATDPQFLEREMLIEMQVEVERGHPGVRALPRGRPAAREHAGPRRLARARARCTH